jgi:D-tyrosyl-tRNA(Tyr) deacylase
MIALIQRVKYASISVNNEIISKIDAGLLIFLGVTHTDNKEDIDWLTNKIINLRIFDDVDGVMNLSCLEKEYNILTISQFTLHARTKKGNRPSYIDSAKPEIAESFYNQFINTLNQLTKKEIKTGIFGANMQIDLCNDGPVTIIIDSKNRK